MACPIRTTGFPFLLEVFNSSSSSSPSSGRLLERVSGLYRLTMMMEEGSQVERLLTSMSQSEEEGEEGGEGPSRGEDASR